MDQCLGTETYSPPGCLARIPQRRPRMLHWYLGPFWLRVRRFPAVGGPLDVGSDSYFDFCRSRVDRGWHCCAATLLRCEMCVVSWRVGAGRGEMRCGWRVEARGRRDHSVLCCAVLYRTVQTRRRRRALLKFDSFCLLPLDADMRTEGREKRGGDCTSEVGARTRVVAQWGLQP